MMKRKFKELDIRCLGLRTKRANDVEIELNGKNIIEDLHISSLRWKVTSSYAILELCSMRSDTIVINYPISSIWLEFKHLSIKSNNTSRGTTFYWDGKEIESSGILDFDVRIGSYGTINEVTLTTC